MTAAEWAACDNPTRMLDFLYGIGPVKPHQLPVSDRKLRLFAAACWRKSLERCTPLVTNVGTRDPMRERWLRVAPAAEEMADGGSPANPTPFIGNTTYAPLRANAVEAAAYSVPIGMEEVNEELADLLRDIFGPDPSRPFPRLLDSSRTADVLSLAQAVYSCIDGHGRMDASALAQLSDALEEAGVLDVSSCVICCGYGVLCFTGGPYAPDEYRSCPACAVMRHLRSPGPHYKGCWVVDLLLNKE